MHATRPPKPGLPLDDLCASHLLHLQAARRRPGAIVMYMRILERFARFLETEPAQPPTVEALTRDGARRYLVHLQGQPCYAGVPDRMGGRLAQATLNQHAR